MTAAGKIIFLKRPPSATWNFTGGNVENDTRKEFSARVQGNGRARLACRGFGQRMEAAEALERVTLRRAPSLEGLPALAHQGRALDFI